MKGFASAAVAAIGVLFTACAGVSNSRAYEGPPRPSSEVAVLEDRLSQVKSVDGRSWPLSDGKVIGGYELLPGTHSVTADVSTMTLTARPATLSFVAEAGHVYVVKYSVLPGASEGKIWIQDRTTGKTVSE